MRDLTIRLQNRPGALAEMGEALGRAGVSVEGGGGFVVDGTATAHFLFEDGARAREVLEQAGIEVLADREVLIQRLNQGQPGQLGRVARLMANDSVNIEVVYSDHSNQLVLAVDDVEKGRAVSGRWAAQTRREHVYRARVEWTGTRGGGTSGYREYERSHLIGADGKPAIPASADPHFRGDAAKGNPEELLLASLSSCHQLGYLHLCADARVVVTAYEDAAEAVMVERADGTGEFVRATLRPRVTLAAGADRALALSLHRKAHALCFIANSVRFPVAVEPAFAG